MRGHRRATAHRLFLVAVGSGGVGLNGMSAALALARGDPWWSLVLAVACMLASLVLAAAGWWAIMRAVSAGPEPNGDEVRGVSMILSRRIQWPELLRGGDYIRDTTALIPAAGEIRLAPGEVDLLLRSPHLGDAARRLLQAMRDYGIYVLDDGPGVAWRADHPYWWRR